MYRRAYSEDVLACGCDEKIDDGHRPKELDLTQKNNTLELPLDSLISPKQQSQMLSHRQKDQFKTPTGKHKQISPKNFKTNPLYILCPPNDDSNTSGGGKFKSSTIAIGNKNIPKVNLNQMFNISPRDHHQRYNTSYILPSPKDPHQGSSIKKLSFDNVCQSDGMDHSMTTSIENDCAATTIGAAVHKSYSAPTFSSSPTLSPRFLKSAAIMKRRSRHLSDRSSERSSVGSDEQFSDEEFAFDVNAYSPSTSPTKIASFSSLRLFPKSLPFGKRSLLGECKVFFF